FFTPSIQIRLFVIAFVLFVAGFLLGNQLLILQAQNQLIPDEAHAELFVIYEQYQYIKENYVNQPVDMAVLVDGALAGMVDALEDEYSGYMNPESFTSFSGSFSGDMEGIGAIIRSDMEAGIIEIADVLPNGPAEKAGVVPGDVFISVDGEPVAGMSQTDLVTRVRGQAGTTVVIVFERGDKQLTFEIVRERFEIPSVFSEVLEDNIGYISFFDFNQRTRGQIDAALAELNVNELRGLIIDVRNNPGGLLTSAIEVGSAFVPDGGVILHEVFGNGEEITFESDGTFANITVPIVFLVNERSASASELVAGAIQDYGLATIIGETTFGKGTVQQLRNLSNGGGVRLTIAEWLTPNRNSIQSNGVTPDIIIRVDNDQQLAEMGRDPQLEAAIEFLLSGDVNPAEFEVEVTPEATAEATETP
ncbi:MAG: S41 family peptidase, partial [Anaerolineae bacterium]|nr:S41 family peptidase [Anaerolineae bacterium]